MRGLVFERLILKHGFGNIADLTRAPGRVAVVVKLRETVVLHGVIHAVVYDSCAHVLMPGGGERGDCAWNQEAQLLKGERVVLLLLLLSAAA